MRYGYELNVSTKDALKVNLAELVEQYDLDQWNGTNDKVIPFQVWQKQNNDIFDRDWLDELSWSIYTHTNFRLAEWSMIFHRTAGPPFRHAHVDVAPYSPPMAFVFGLNFTVKEDDAEMIWYEDSYDINDVQSYINVPTDTLKEIDRFHVGASSLSLINTNRFHDVDNKGKERWCISMRTKTEEIVSWNDVVDRFKGLIV